MSQSLKLGFPPHEGGRGERQQDSAQLIGRRPVRRRPRGGEEAVTSRPGQVQCRGQSTYRLDVRPPPLPALEGADRMNRKSRNRGQLFLCEASRLAERPELSAE